MPAPSPSWNLVRVFGTWGGQNGALLAGNAKVTIPVRVTNRTDDRIIPRGKFLEVPLQTSNATAPSLDIQVPATDDPDNNETGWKVLLEVSFTNGADTEVYTLDVPYQSAGIDLATVALPQTIPQQQANYKVGVAGGLARLDANGKVVDATGNPVAGVSSWLDISGKPSVFPPVIGNTSTTAKAGNYVPTWTEIGGKPATFTPSVHSHAAGDISGLDTALALKADLSAMNTALAGKAATVHTHTVSQVTDIVTKPIIQNADGSWPARTTVTTNRTVSVRWVGTLPGPPIGTAAAQAVVVIDSLDVTTVIPT